MKKKKLKKVTSKEIKKILIKIKPGIKFKLNNKKINLIEDGFIDSFDIIQIILEIEKINKKKINIAKVNREAFSSVNNILKFFK